MAESVHRLREDAGIRDLNEFRVIVVTGPQRSGTTFMGKAFAHDMRWPYVDEQVFGVDNVDLWRHVVEGASHCIVQCPTMMRFAHDVPDDVLVVVMRRDVHDIVVSQERVGWSDNDIELQNYGCASGIASEVKYEWWDAHKSRGPRHWLEVDYESMQDHPLWVPRDDRRDFEAKQTEVRDPLPS